MTTMTDQIVSTTSNVMNHYRHEFAQLSGNGASAEPVWLREKRLSAFNNFMKRGFPSLKDEEWRFTNISPLTKIDFEHPVKPTQPHLSLKELALFLFKPAAYSRLVLVNGWFQPELSDFSALPDGVKAGGLRTMMSQAENDIRSMLAALPTSGKSPFSDLNLAFAGDGAFIHVLAGVKVDRPMQVLHIAVPDLQTQMMVSPRNIFILSEDSSATIIESFVSLTEQKYFTNTVTETIVNDRASLDYLKIQKENYHAYHVSTMDVTQGNQSRCTLFSLSLGSAIARNDFNITIAGEESAAMLDGLYIASGDQLIDHHTLIDHTRPNCSSREVFKGVLAGTSRAVFNGKIVVRPAAQKTDSKQTNKNLLLSDSVVIDTKPQLEIFADDVKCTHGATVGGLDEAAKFYVKSRGISEENACGLLTVGFAGEATQYIANENLRRYVDAQVVKRLQQGVVKTLLPHIVHLDQKEL
jgi:Fe-S cluster assembly protein SufD